MTFRSVTSVIVVLAATAAWTQSAQPGITLGTPNSSLQGLVGRRGPVANKTADPLGLAATHERIEDTESMLTQMRVALRQMHAQAAKSKPTDSETKANLELWELMLSHLDKELQQLRATLAAREDMEARRAALYKQADAKAETAAQTARAAQSARFAQAEKNPTGTATPAATAPSTGQSAQQSSAVQTAPSQPSPVAPPNNSASPN